MKVLMLNGSCNPKGCTYTALTEVGKTLTSAGIDYEIVQLGGDPVRDCIGCNQCSKNGCVFTDGGVNDFIAKARQATASYSAHRSITPTPAGGCCPSWTGYSTPEAAPLPESPALRWPPPGGQAPPPVWTLWASTSASPTW